MCNKLRDYCMTFNAKMEWQVNDEQKIKRLEWKRQRKNWMKIGIRFVDEAACARAVCPSAVYRWMSLILLLVVWLLCAHSSIASPMPKQTAASNGNGLMKMNIVRLRFPIQRLSSLWCLWSYRMLNVTQLILTDNLFDVSNRMDVKCCVVCASAVIALIMCSFEAIIFDRYRCFGLCWWFGGWDGTLTGGWFRFDGNQWRLNVAGGFVRRWITFWTCLEC